ncbi:MAG: N-acetylmuramoyl-L-alanine amidase [Frankiales bacterium]|nr:N-acetylmuramoyl-L-alanine amidase [Frankiales bacterium]
MRRRLRTALLPALLLLLGTFALPAGAAVDPGTGQAYETARVVVPMTFPVAGPTSFSDNFLACRSGCARMHMGQDLMGPKMSPLVAAFDGVVTSVSRDSRSGNTLTIAADRGPAAGWSAIYVHVNNDTPGTDDGRGTGAYAFPAGIEPGARVLAGQLVAWRGDSGNAESTGPHLHLELRKGSGWGGTVYNAYPSLAAARRLAVPAPSGPHPAGSLMRHPTGSLWLLSDDAKRPVSAAVLASLGRSAASAVPMTSSESLGYRTGPAALPPDGAVLRDPAGTTWLVTAGTRAKAPAPGLAALGLAAPRVWPVGDADLAGLPVVEELPQTPFYAGALHRVDGRVHQVGADGLLHPATPAVTGSHGWTTSDVAALPEGSELPAQGAPLGLRDGTLVQTPGHLVAVVSGGAVRRLRDARQVAAYGYSGRPRQVVPAAELAGLRTAEISQR